MLSVPHLIIIFVVALVVFGTEKLPELARNLGKVMAEFKRATGELRSTFEGHMRDLERESDSRRIGGAASGPAETAPAAPISIAKPGAVSSLGTVPTLPPQLGAPLEGQEAATGEPTAGQGEVSPPPDSHGHTEVDGPAEPKPEPKPESIPETTFDGGTRPA